MERVKIGNKIRRWMEAVYKKPIARFSINGQLIEQIKLTRGVCQGCPVLPLIINVGLEMLAINIRENQCIKGIKLHEHYYKIALYADDMSIFVRNPNSSQEQMMILLQKFGLLSGYKINQTKSEMIGFNVTMKNMQSIQKLCSAKWKNRDVKYLGIMFADVKYMTQDNLGPLIEKIDKQLKKWLMLPLTWLGRISVIKMNVLPRLLFLFTNLNIWIPKNKLITVQRKINKFIWQNKKARQLYCNNPCKVEA